MGEFIQSPFFLISFKKQLKDFLNKLKMIKELLLLREMMLENLQDFKEKFSEVFNIPKDLFSLSLNLGFQRQERMIKIDGNYVSDKTNVDSDVEALKKNLTTHGFIKIFDNFAQENIFKGKLTALEKFIKYRNLC